MLVVPETDLSQVFCDRRNQIEVKHYYRTIQFGHLIISQLGRAQQKHIMLSRKRTSKTLN